MADKNIFKVKNKITGKYCPTIFNEYEEAEDFIEYQFRGRSKTQVMLESVGFHVSAKDFDIQAFLIVEDEEDF